MLKQRSLDDSSYEAVYEKAMTGLAQKAPWWTHREASDPGVTLLEMWAVLADMQSFYLDQVQESHYLKYLKLLGMERHEGRSAVVWVFFGNVKERRVLPRGTKLLSDNMVFETEEEAELAPNGIKAFYLGMGVNRTAAMKMRRKTSFALPGRGVLFLLTLKEPLKEGEKLSFYVLLDERESRNPVEGDFSMVSLAWEYQGRDGRWREAEVVRDETKGLLFSGYVCLRVSHIHDGQGGGVLSVRCRLREGEYDIPPVLYKIYFNMVRTRQRDTLCCEETVELPRGGGRIALSSYLAKTGDVRVLKGLKGDLWQDVTGECEIDPPITATRGERYVYFPGKGRLQIICTDSRVAKQDLTYPVTGVAGQQIDLPWEHILPYKTELMLGRGDDKLYCAYRREDAWEDRYANAWHWQEGKSRIVLGDGRHGDIPPASRTGILFTSLVLWNGKRGNVSIGRVGRLDREDLFPGVTCSNLMAGKGGLDYQLPSEQFMEIRENFPPAGRMVTEGDIESLVKQTPGLLIQGAVARWRDGAVEVGVLAKAPLTGEYLEEFYRKRVEEFLEPYRLAGSRFRVVIDKGE